MSWGVFFATVAVLYVLYYAGNLLFDLYLRNAKGVAADMVAQYSVSDLVDTTEAPQDIVDEDYLEEEFEEDYEDYEQEEQPLDSGLQEYPVTADGHAFAHQTASENSVAMPVIGQGIPLEEFLQNARRLSNAIPFSS
ncbi:hypothetical protein [Pontibacter mangrovi]|uniref:Uncharacterized protein n=2 Tax=Pseudomonadati TaxID=3379134 RepID=A0A501WJS7_9RHOB|nr:hypothetical protein [Pontibacter mangrovi]TPE41568.1 hypothetical protein FJM65_19415 [Pontibacter mangrovi]TPE48695.1 hypothetical protein FJM51_17215 [Amaricoccus solimangrovi]